ncbi:hypothetical protein AruPA_06880 [Acidiphilium sp. PA]|uniref:hypothetical protein n=1 Tax=Acidiphilium sp. PA TaxID=2871705 RepID=UPI002244920F|nr:hypothetical protein [Acidiphilium sp. PA]MCW8306755.1 hypothetical protein [Acidiphilium sp. PA]
MRATPTNPPFVIRCFIVMMNALCDAVAEHGPAGYVPIPMVNRIWTRLQNLTTRFLAALARGPIQPRAKPAAKPTPEPNPEAQPTEPPRARRKRLTLPCREAWLYRLIPETGFTRFALQTILTDPEFAGLLEANPRLIRILAPLYHAMGIDLPAQPPVTPTPPPDSRRHILFGTPDPTPLDTPPPNQDFKIQPA